MTWPRTLSLELMENTILRLWAKYNNIGKLSWDIYKISIWNSKYSCEVKERYALADV